MFLADLYAFSLDSETTINAFFTSNAFNILTTSLVLGVSKFKLSNTIISFSTTFDVSADFIATFLIDFGVEIQRRNWYDFTYCLSGLPVTEHKSCKNPVSLTVGNTDFSAPSSGSKQDKFVELDWKTPISNRFTLNITGYKVRPLVVCEIVGLSVEATGKPNSSSGNSQLVTDNENITKAFLGVGGSALFNTLLTDFKGSIAGGKNYLYGDVAIRRALFSDAYVGAGYQYHEMRFPNDIGTSSLKMQGPYLELLAWF